MSNDTQLFGKFITDLHEHLDKTYPVRVAQRIKNGMSAVFAAIRETTETPAEAIAVINSVGAIFNKAQLYTQIQNANPASSERNTPQDN